MKQTPKKLHAWNLSAAGREFGLDRKTLASRLAKTGAEPDATGHYTTRQILAALFTEEDLARHRILTEQADAVAMQNRRSRETLIGVDEAAAMSRQLAASIRAKVAGLPLAPASLKPLLTEIDALAAVDFAKELSAAD